MGIAAQFGELVERLVKRLSRAKPKEDEPPKAVKGASWGDGEFSELSQSDIDRIIGRDD